MRIFNRFVPEKEIKKIFEKSVTELISRKNKAKLSDFQIRSYAAFYFSSKTIIETLLSEKKLMIDKKEIQKESLLNAYNFLTILQLFLFFIREKNLPDLREKRDIGQEKYIKDLIFLMNDGKRLLNQYEDFKKLHSSVYDPRDFDYSVIVCSIRILIQDKEYMNEENAAMDDKIYIVLAAGNLLLYSAKTYDEVVLDGSFDHVLFK